MSVSPTIGKRGWAGPVPGGRATGARPIYDRSSQAASRALASVASE